MASWPGVKRAGLHRGPKFALKMAATLGVTLPRQVDTRGLRLAPAIVQRLKRYTDLRLSLIPTIFGGERSHYLAPQGCPTATARAGTLTRAMHRSEFIVTNTDFDRALVGCHARQQMAKRILRRLEVIEGTRS